MFFASGNVGNHASQSVAMPGAAKNVITAGASEGSSPTDASGADLYDGCGAPGSGANNAQDIITQSG